MLTLPDAWTWDFWIADDGDRYHAFFLRASRALLDPERRHRRASIGHAVSTDLRSWTVLPDALVHEDPDAFDDQATWTGSVVRDPAGDWLMFFTGISRAENGMVQRIGMATSDDLITWQRVDGFLLEADERWYEKYGGPTSKESWRDPWVYPDPDGNGWHMLITTCVPAANVADPFDRGVVGHATSPDLRRWTAGPPLSRPDAGFGHPEVLQVENVEGRPVLIFSCLDGDMSAARRVTGGAGAIWTAPAASMTGPFDLAQAEPLSGRDLYAGRIIQDRSGQWVLLGFLHEDEQGDFVGGICDPRPIHWVETPDGEFRLRQA